MRQRLWGILLTGLLSLLSNTTNDHLPRTGTAHSSLGLTTSIINQKKNPLGLLTDQPDESNSTTVVFSSWVTLICIKLTEMNEHIIQSDCSMKHIF